MKKTIKSKQTYTFEIIHFEDGTSQMNRNNKGFSVIELIGITQLVQGDMLKLISNNVEDSVDEIKRNGKAKII